VLPGLQVKLPMGLLGGRGRMATASAPGRGSALRSAPLAGSKAGRCLLIAFVAASCSLAAGAGQGLARSTFSWAETVATAENGKLAFATAKRGRWQIDVMNPDGTDRAKLPTSTGFDFNPAWSPDGTRIADVCSNFTICVMNADGSSQTRLTDTGPWKERWLYDGPPTWSPDGSQIAFASTRAGRLADIYVVNSDGSALRRLGGTGGDDANPAWSPDGTKLAFDSDDGRSRDVYVMTADGTSLTRLTASAGDQENPSWSPDGARIAFTQTRADEPFHLYTMNADGSDQRALTTGRWDELSLAWSPDGTRIAFAGDRGGNWDIYAASPLGTPVRRLTAGTPIEATPDWQTIPAAPKGPLPTAPSPPVATGNARLVGSLLAWTIQLLAEAELLSNVAGGSAAIRAANRFRASALRAKRSLAAARPESARGRRVQKLTVAAFAWTATTGRELSLAGRAERRGQTRSLLRHLRAALTATQRATSLLAAATRRAGLAGAA
jgi:Tol biopolymer transport system component